MLGSRRSDPLFLPDLACCCAQAAWVNLVLGATHLPSFAGEPTPGFAVFVGLVLGVVGCGLLVVWKCSDKPATRAQATTTRGRTKGP